MKTRIVYTKIWNDDFFSSLSDDSQKLFLWCLTNQYIGLSGIFEATDRIIQFETGLTVQRLIKSKQELQKKIIFQEGYVIILNHEKYNFYKGEKNQRALEKEMELVPENIRNVLLKGNSYTLSPVEDTVSTNGDTSINHKSEIINQKERGVLGGEINIFIEKYNECFKKQTQATDKRTEQFKARRKRYSLEQLLTAIENLSRSNFFTGSNDRGWIADPDYILRSDEIVDKALNLVIDKPKRQTTTLIEISKELSRRKEAAHV